MRIRAPRLLFCLTVASVAGCATGRGVLNPDQERADFTTITGMAAAIDEIDRQRGTEAQKELIARYEKLFKAEPQNPFRRFLWAYVLADRNLGWQELAKVTKLNDRFYWAYVGMGAILDEWKIFDQAEQNFAKALRLGPEIAMGHGRFGQMLLHKGDSARAREQLAIAVKLDPAHATFELNLARAEAAVGRKAEAILVYGRVVGRLPDSLPARAELARLLRSEGQREQAAAQLTEAAKRAPENFEIHQELAQLLLELGRDAEAVQAFGTACGLKPDALDCWRALTALAVKLGQEDVAVQAFERIAAADPSDLPAQSYLAPRYLAAGAIERALPAYEAILGKEPENTLAMAALAEIYERGEQFMRAIEFNQMVLTREPGQAAARAALGRLFERFHILEPPLGGKSLDEVFTKNRKQIAEVYKLRLKDRSGLKGDLLIKVTLENSGQVREAAVVKNTVGDEVIEICAIWNIRRSTFPAGFGATYDFELSLTPGN